MPRWSTIMALPVRSLRRPASSIRRRIVETLTPEPDCHLGGGETSPVAAATRLAVSRSAFGVEAMVTVWRALPILGGRCVLPQREAARATVERGGFRRSVERDLLDAVELVCEVQEPPTVRLIRAGRCGVRAERVKASDEVVGEGGEVRHVRFTHDPIPREMCELLVEHAHVAIEPLDELLRHRPAGGEVERGDVVGVGLSRPVILSTPGKELDEQPRSQQGGVEHRPVQIDRVEDVVVCLVRGVSTEELDADDGLDLQGEEGTLELVLGAGLASGVHGHQRYDEPADAAMRFLGCIASPAAPDALRSMTSAAEVTNRLSARR